MRLRDVVNNILRKVFAIIFNFGEKLGIHITPSRFSYPTPSAGDLTDDVFMRKSDCIGIDWIVNTQEYYLHNIFSKYANEVKFEKNRGLSLIDAAIYHSMI